MPQIAKVAVAAATYAIDKPYDYIAPDEALSGQRVLVPFGRGHRVGEGLILSVKKAVPDRPLKAIREIMDPEPLVTEREIKLAIWMCQRYFCTFYDAIRTILPAAVWYRYRELWEAADPSPAEPLTGQAAELVEMLRGGSMETDQLRAFLQQAAEPSPADVGHGQFSAFPLLELWLNYDKRLDGIA